MSLFDFLSVQWFMLGLYAGGFALLTPPLALGGGVAGWWLNRQRPLAPQLAGALLVALVGAYLAACWRSAAGMVPAAGWVAFLWQAVKEATSPVYMLVTADGLYAVIIGASFFVPLLAGLLLFLLAGHYENSLDGVPSRLRARLAALWADYRAGQTEKIVRKLKIRRERILAGLPVVPYVPIGAAPAPAAPPEATSGPSTPAMITARAGEMIALPGQLIVDGVPREVFINITVEVPPPQPVALRSFGQGSVSGFLRGSYYAVAILHKARFLLILLCLWLFWAPLTAYIERKVIDAGSEIASRAVSHLKVW